MDRLRVMIKFRVRIRVRAWSGVTVLTLLSLCSCTFCSDPETFVLPGLILFIQQLCLF